MRPLIPLLALLLPLGAGARQIDSLPFIRPPYLQAGDTVGIVAPAGKLPEKVDTAQIRHRFEEWGLHVRFGTCLNPDKKAYFAAPDSVRAAELQGMIDDPAVKAVIACRGGYGSVRLLPHLRLEALREHPKWIVGFSDITTLHLALRRLGIESIHGPMPGGFRFREDEEDSSESLREALFGEIRRIEVDPHPRNCYGEARGRLAGGNLTVICAANGTPEALRCDTPTILFIEEIGEFAYRIDRMMQSLERCGVLCNLQAVIVGHFTKTLGCDRFGVEEPESILESYLRPLGIPVVFGFPAGHDEPNLALYLGREITVCVDQTGARIDFEP